MDWILFGPPGCGKGTQAERLSASRNLFHFSTGDVLRDNVARATELGRKADVIMKRGDLVPDDIIIGMVRGKLSEPAITAKSGVLFDGFPRTIPQAEALAAALMELGRKLGGVLSLEVNEEEIVERLAKRGRPDDTPETVRARLAVYRKQTSPLLDYYRRAGHLIGLNGMGTIEEIEARLRQAIEQKVAQCRCAGH